MRLPLYLFDLLLLVAAAIMLTRRRHAAVAAAVITGYRIVAVPDGGGANVTFNGTGEPGSGNEVRGHSGFYDRIEQPCRRMCRTP